jgi:segregation and condensation protein A
VATSPDLAAHPGRGGFAVTLENFSGPFDLLLSLIAKHRLDVTEIALAQVTDEFIAHIRAAGEWDLSQASEFLVVAATLLDLKAARLLPAGTVEDAEDLELLEARDLLFARLLQYRAFKEVAGHLAERLEASAHSHPRSVRLEPHLAALLPELVITAGPERLAALAAAVSVPRPAPPGVDVTHLHAPVVSVRDQAALLVDRLRRQRVTTFRALSADAGALAVVVARFLALLELFREGAVTFEQAGALAELTVRWSGPERGDVRVAEDDDVRAEATA